MKKKVVLCALAVFLFTVPVYADSSGARDPVIYEEGAENNLSVSIDYQGAERLYSNDVYRIIYEQEERQHRAHIDVDLRTGHVSGYLEPGHYQVLAVAYLGFNETLIEQPVACNLELRLYEGEMTEFVLAVGQEAVDSFIEGKDMTKIHQQTDTATNYDFYDTSEEIQEAAEERLGEQMAEAVEQVEEDIGTDLGELAGEENPNSPFVDESIFGDDEEALNNYHKSLQDQGYMDAYGNYTDKAIATMEALERYSGDANQDDTDTETAEAEAGTDSGPASSAPSNVEVKETRYDAEGGEETGNNSPRSAFAFMAGVLLFPVAALIGIAAYIWKQRRK